MSFSKLELDYDYISKKLDFKMTTTSLSKLTEMLANANKSPHLDCCDVSATLGVDYYSYRYYHNSILRQPFPEESAKEVGDNRTLKPWIDIIKSSKAVRNEVYGKPL